MTVSVAVRVTPPYVAEIVTEALFRADEVVTVKVLLVVAGGITKLDGTEASEDFELASVTTAPFAGAAEVSVTVPFTEPPPLMLVG